MEIYFKKEKLKFRGYCGAKMQIGKSWVRTVRTCKPKDLEGHLDKNIRQLIVMLNKNFLS